VVRHGKEAGNEAVTERVRAPIAAETECEFIASDGEAGRQMGQLPVVGLNKSL